MSERKYRYLAAALTAVSCLQLTALWLQARNDTHAMWDVRYARIAIRRIEGNRYEALRVTVPTAVTCLEDIETCYAKWNWHRADLQLGGLVEEQRAAAVRTVIEDLRKRTGLELGDDSRRWIEALKRPPSGKGIQ